MIELTEFTDPETLEYNVDPHWTEAVRRGTEFSASRTGECMRANAPSRPAPTVSEPERSALFGRRRKADQTRRLIAKTTG